MKKNSLTIVLVIIIFILIGYILHDKLQDNSSLNNDLEDNKVAIIDKINLDYTNIYLANDGYAYISPLSSEEIEKLEVGSSLKERLNTLYERAFYFDIYINNYKLKGFKVKLDSDIKKIRKILIEDNPYIVFIKENNTLGLFNYEDYYDLLYTKVKDNYNKYQNVKDIKDNKIFFLDGNKEDFKLEK